MEFTAKYSRKIRQALAVLISLLTALFGTSRYLEAGGMRGTVQEHWVLALWLFASIAIGMLCFTALLISTKWGQQNEDNTYAPEDSRAKHKEAQ